VIALDRLQHTEMELAKEATRAAHRSAGGTAPFAVVAFDRDLGRCVRARQTQAEDQIARIQASGPDQHLLRSRHSSTGCCRRPMQRPSM